MRSLVKAVICQPSNPLEFFVLMAAVREACTKRAIY